MLEGGPYYIGAGLPDRAPEAKAEQRKKPAMEMDIFETDFEVPNLEEASHDLSEYREPDQPTVYPVAGERGDNDPTFRKENGATQTHTSDTAEFPTEENPSTSNKIVLSPEELTARLEAIEEHIRLISLVLLGGEELEDQAGQWLLELPEEQIDERSPTEQLRDLYRQLEHMDVPDVGERILRARERKKAAQDAAKAVMEKLRQQRKVSRE